MQTEQDELIEKLIDCSLLNSGDTLYYNDYAVALNDKREFEWTSQKKNHTSSKLMDFVQMVNGDDTGDDIWNRMKDSHGNSLQQYRQQYCEMMGISNHETSSTINTTRKRARTVIIEEIEEVKEEDNDDDNDDGEQQETKKQKTTDRKQLMKLLYKNSTLSRVDMSKLFNLNTFNLLSDEEKLSLSQYLPDIDLDSNGVALPHVFKNQFFRESLSQLQSLIKEGWMNPNKNLREIIELNNRKNKRKGTNEQNMEFWFDALEHMDMAWVKDLN
jgi:hypothetical protein